MITGFVPLFHVDMRLLVSIVLSGLAGVALAQTAAPTPPAAAPTPVTATSAPAHAEHAHTHALIRQTHLKRLEERLNTDKDTLRQQCRFVSDISTPPPLNKVVLTFDDGPEPGETEYVLDVLDRHQISAAFFFIGEKMARYPDLVAKVQQKRRHLIGSHSWDHPNFHDISEDTQRIAIQRGLAQMPADGTDKYFRYPYGNSTCFGNSLVHEASYRITGWHVDSCDWAFDHNGSVTAHEALSCGVLSQYHSDFIGHVLASLRARRGGIVLMHEIHPNTLHQLETLIQGIEKDGFTFTTIDDPALASSMR